MILSLALLLSAPVTSRDGQPSAPACTRAAIGADAFCDISGTRIHYVDWGGNGPAIVLLAGLGNSARIFDDLAPRLRRGHRVIAITRRGYGKSGDAADGDYSNARLVGDILGVMDGLGILRASFVGHSFAGGELATLGADYADRVERLVYLDAAYDRSAVPAIMAAMPPMPGPSPSDRASVATMTRWRAAALGVPATMIAADMRAVMKDTDGGAVSRTDPKTDAATLAGDIAAPPRYARIAAPSLAIYGSKDVAEQAPPSMTATQRRALIAFAVAKVRPWMLGARHQFLGAQRCGTAYVVPHGAHYIFLQYPAWTARTTLAYLASRYPCSFRAANAR